MDVLLTWMTRRPKEINLNMPPGNHIAWMVTTNLNMPLPSLSAHNHMHGGSVSIDDKVAKINQS